MSSKQEEKVQYKKKVKRKTILVRRQVRTQLGIKSENICKS